MSEHSCCNEIDERKTPIALTRPGFKINRYTGAITKSMFKRTTQQNTSPEEHSRIMPAALDSGLDLELHHKLPEGDLSPDDQHVVEEIQTAIDQLQ